MRGKFTLLNVPTRLARLKEDPWKDYFATKQSITAAMRRALAA
jgi:bifunctional non-homologous end joining protein LigD